MDINKLIILLQEKLPTCEVTLQETIKNNNIVYKGVSIRKQGDNISKLIYIDDYPDDPEEACEIIIKTYNKDFPIQDIVDKLQFFDKIQNNIKFKLINYDKNKDFLLTVPHRRFLDLAIVYILQEDCYSLTITTNLMKEWNVSEQDLFNFASLNREKAKVIPMNEMIPFTTDMLIISTTENHLYGASTLIYDPNPIVEYAKSINSDLIIFPCSIHELLLLKKDKAFNKQYAINMVREINNNNVDPKEVLSDNIYIYSLSKNKFEVIK